MIYYKIAFYDDIKIMVLISRLNQYTNTIVSDSTKSEALLFCNKFLSGLTAEKISHILSIMSEFKVARSGLFPNKNIQEEKLQKLYNVILEYQSNELDEYYNNLNIAFHTVIKNRQSILNIFKVKITNSFGTLIHRYNVNNEVLNQEYFSKFIIKHTPKDKIINKRISQYLKRTNITEYYATILAICLSKSINKNVDEIAKFKNKVNYSKLNNIEEILELLENPSSNIKDINKFESQDLSFEDCIRIAISYNYDIKKRFNHIKKIENMTVNDDYQKILALNIPVFFENFKTGDNAYLINIIEILGNLIKTNSEAKKICVEFFCNKALKISTDITIAIIDSLCRMDLKDSLESKLIIADAMIKGDFLNETIFNKFTKLIEEIGFSAGINNRLNAAIIVMYWWIDCNPNSSSIMKQISKADPKIISSLKRRMKDVHGKYKEINQNIFENKLSIKNMIFLLPMLSTTHPREEHIIRFFSKAVVKEYYKHKTIESNTDNFNYNDDYELAKVLAEIISLDTQEQSIFKIDQLTSSDLKLICTKNKENLILKKALELYDENQKLT